MRPGTAESTSSIFPGVYTWIIACVPAAFTITRKAPPVYFVLRWRGGNCSFLLCSWVGCFPGGSGGGSCAGDKSHGGGGRVPPAWGCPCCRSGLCCSAPPCLHPPPVCAGLEEFRAGLWCVNSPELLAPLRLRSAAASHVSHSARLHPRLGKGTRCHLTSAPRSPEPSASASGVRECMKAVMTSMEYSWDIHGHCVWLNKVRRSLPVLAPAFLPVTSHSRAALGMSLSSSSCTRHQLGSSWETEYCGKVAASLLSSVLFMLTKCFR